MGIGLSDTDKYRFCIEEETHINLVTEFPAIALAWRIVELTSLKPLQILDSIKSLELEVKL